MEYCVATCSLFEMEIKQSIIKAENEYQAIKLAMLHISGDSIEERKWQEDENYPKDKESLEELLINSDILVSVIELP